MAGRIKQEDVEAVRERTDIVKLVSQYLTLKKAGGDYMTGLCPFHQEKTPSFSVSPAKQVFYCHGCGKGGDAITFIRELEHLGFTEAVERLAQQAGVALRYEGDSPAERRAAAAGSRSSRRTRRPRGCSARCWRTGGGRGGPRVRQGDAASRPSPSSGSASGTRPAYPDFLLRRMSREFSPEILLEAGLATRGDEGSVRDRFRGRITFPIHDLQGRGIGFGAQDPADRRARERAGEVPQHGRDARLPEGAVLYNLTARERAIGERRAFVVEGYTDVIALVQAGVANAVATCGTALGRSTSVCWPVRATAVLAFDSDEAGARAAERAYAFQERTRSRRS